MKAWEIRFNDAMRDLTYSLSRMTNAIQAGDFGTTQAACERVGQSGKELGAALPAYNQQVTNEVQTMVSEIAAAHRACQDFKPTMSPAQFNQFVTDLNRAISQGSALTQQGG